MSLDQALETGTTEPQFPEPETPVTKPEIEVLRERADALGLKYRSNTGVEKLRALVNAALNGDTPPPSDEDEEGEDEAALASQEAPAVNTSIPKPEVAVASAPVAQKAVIVEAVAPRKLTKNEKIHQMRLEARKLVRVRITCHNPNKAELEAEYFTFGNDYVSITRLVPFETEWHVEQALLDMIREKKYQHFYSKKNGPGMPETREAKLVREYAIEILPPLTPEELADLRSQQAINNSIDKEQE